MSERRPRRKVEFIESYWTGGIYGADYHWDDNHGELIRCKECKWYSPDSSWCNNLQSPKEQTFFCADGERRETE